MSLKTFAPRESIRYDFTFHSAKVLSPASRHKTKN